MWYERRSIALTEPNKFLFYFQMVHVVIKETDTPSSPDSVFL